MFSPIPVVSRALARMFDATASVYVDNPTVVNGVTRHENTKLLGTVRCRISYKRVMPVATEDVVDKDLQRIILIYATDSGIQIPDGSKIVVSWDDGRGETFQNSGLPQVYTHSTQVPLEKAAVKP